MSERLPAATVASPERPEQALKHTSGECMGNVRCTAGWFT